MCPIRRRLRCVRFVATVAWLAQLLGCEPSTPSSASAGAPSSPPPSVAPTAPVGAEASVATEGDEVRGAAELGIEVVAVHLSAAGHMLDFRYRIIDAAKAAPLMDEAVHPVLIHQATGTRLGVPSSPKVGALRQTGQRSRLDRVFFIIFGNRGRLVRTGDRVTIAFGDREIRNLLAQ